MTAQISFSRQPAAYPSTTTGNTNGFVGLSQSFEPHPDCWRYLLFSSCPSFDQGQVAFQQLCNLFLCPVHVTEGF